MFVRNLADESLAGLYLLAVGYESAEEVKTIMESFPTMEEFAKRYGMAIDDPDLKRAYDKYWEADMEYKTMVAYAKREGRAAGLAEGRAEGIAEGRAEGIVEGRQEGRNEALRQSIEALRAAGMNEAADLLEKHA